MRIGRGLTLLLVLAIIATPILAKKSKSKGSNSSSGSRSRQKEERRRGKGSSSESESREIRKPEINVQGRLFAETSKPCVDSLATCRIYLIRGLCRFDTYARICPKSCNKCRPEADSQTDLSDKSQLKEGDVKLNTEDKRLQKDSHSDGTNSESREHKGQKSGSHETDGSQESGKNRNAEKPAPTFDERVKSTFKSQPNERDEELKIETDGNKEVSGVRKYIDWFRGRGSKPGHGESGIKANSAERNIKHGSGEKKFKHASHEIGPKPVSGERGRPVKPESGGRGIKTGSSERGLMPGSGERRLKPGSSERGIKSVTSENVEDNGKGNKIVSGVRKYIDWFRGRGLNSGKEESKSVRDDTAVTINSGEKEPKRGSYERGAKHNSHERGSKHGSHEKGFSHGSREAEVQPNSAEEITSDGIGSQIINGVRRYTDWFRGRGKKSGSNEEETRRFQKSGEKNMKLDKDEREIKPGYGEEGTMSGSDVTQITPLSNEENKSKGIGSKIISGAKKYIDWFRRRGTKSGSSVEEPNPVTNNKATKVDSGDSNFKPELNEKKIKPDSGERGMKPLSGEEAKNVGKGNHVLSGVKKYVDWFRGRGSKMESHEGEIKPESGEREIESSTGKLGPGKGGAKSGSGESQITPFSGEGSKDKGIGSKIVSGARNYIEWLRGRGSRMGSDKEETKSESGERGIQTASGEIRNVLGSGETQVTPLPHSENTDKGIGNKIVSGVKKYIAWFRGQGTKAGSNAESSPVTSNKSITKETEELISQNQEIDELRPLEDVEVPSEEEVLSQKQATEEARPQEAVQVPGEVRDETKKDKGIQQQIVSGANRYFDWFQKPGTEVRSSDVTNEPGDHHKEVLSQNQAVEEASDSDEEYFRQEEFIFPDPKPQPLGMESGVIPDDLITASSHEISHEPAKSRPNSGSAWKPSPSSVNGSFLQVDLGQVMLVHGVGTLGDPASQHWTRAYKMSTSTDGRTFTELLDTRDNKTVRNPFVSSIAQSVTVAHTGNVFDTSVTRVQVDLDPVAYDCMSTYAFLKKDQGVKTSYTIFPEGNKDGSSWAHHCLHRYYGNPVRARHIRFSPVNWSGSPSLRVEAFGYRSHNDPLLVKALEKDSWTKNVTGCMCYYDNTKFDCACCQPSGCQCPSNNRHQCVQCGYGSSCGVPDAKPRSLQVDAWTKTETGCACHWDQSRTDCACCQKNGCQCGQKNKNQCVSCGHPDQCGAKEDIFGPNGYCVPKTCSLKTADVHR